MSLLRWSLFFVPPRGLLTLWPLTLNGGLFMVLLHCGFMAMLPRELTTKLTDGLQDDCGQLCS